MTIDQLTAVLAERVMHWVIAPDRFLTGNRGWMPRRRFNPANNLNDAFRLLDESRPDSYTMGSNGTDEFRVRVQIAGIVGEASNKSKSLAITFAVARALGINPEVDT